MPDLSNEFDLNDSAERAVAIAEAARISAKIKNLQAELKWFTVTFREFYHGGATEVGHNGATVQVNIPNEPCAQLDSALIKKLFTVNNYPEYYKVDKKTGGVEMKTRAQAVTFTLPTASQ
jgi:hypothetical protein